MRLQLLVAIALAVNVAALIFNLIGFPRVLNAMRLIGNAKALSNAMGLVYPQRQLDRFQRQTRRLLWNYVALLIGQTISVMLITAWLKRSGW